MASLSLSREFRQREVRQNIKCTFWRENNYRTSMLSFSY